MIDIQKLRELLAKATTGRWLLYTSGKSFCGHDSTLMSTTGAVGYSPKESEDALGYTRYTKDDATLIVAAINELPDPLDEIEALRAKLDVLQRRTTRHSLAKDLGSAVDADAAIMARITAERDKLRKQRNELASDLWSAEDQWGDDYLWEKWELSKHLTDELKEELKKEINK